MTWSTIATAALASFLASMVEFVEVLTIVLAVAATRGWKPSLLGAACGLAVPLALVATPGVSLAGLACGSLAAGLAAILALSAWRRAAQAA